MEWKALRRSSRWSWGRQERIEAARSAYVAELVDQTRVLDYKYPKLVEVRECLEAQRQLMQASAMGGERKGSGGGAASKKRVDRCLVLDEMAIEYCGTLTKEVLASVGNASRSVVACRARKDQKAQMLNLIKESVRSSVCLAIGDGANDVAMIKAGQIGVGIIGKEGMAAVNNSDFAIGQFRFLRSLLLVHGRYAYKRMALFCYYMFYKNIASVLAMYFYTLVAMASGDRLFLALYIEVYNIFYTGIPIIIFGIFDQDVPKAT